MYNTRARVLGGVKNINPESERESKLVQKPLVIWEEKEKNRDPPISPFSCPFLEHTRARWGFRRRLSRAVCAGLAVLSLSLLVGCVSWKVSFCSKEMWYINLALSQRNSPPQTPCSRSTHSPAGGFETRTSHCYRVCCWLLLQLGPVARPNHQFSNSPSRSWELSCEGF